MVVCEIVGRLVAVDGEKKTVEIDAGVSFVTVNVGNFVRTKSSVVAIEVPDINQIREAGKILYEMVRLVGTRQNPGSVVQVTITKHERTSCPTQ